ILTKQEKRIGRLGVRVSAVGGLAEPFSCQLLIARHTVACRVKLSELQLRGADAAFGRALEPFDRAVYIAFDAGSVEIKNGDVERGSRMTVAGRALEPF